MAEQYGINPPTRAPGDPIDVDYPRLFAATGLPEEHHSPDLINHYVMMSTTVEFGNGEFLGRHLPISDPVLQQHFGADDFAEGTFGTRLRELFEGDDTGMQQQVDRLVRDAGMQLARDAVAGFLPPSPPTVTIDVKHSMLTVDRDHTVPLAAPPQRVMDYGPGIKSRHHVDRQVQDMQNDVQPYSYFAITKGPLISGFLWEYWAQRIDDHDPKVLESIMANLCLRREDGIAAATTATVEFHEARKQSTEVADVVIASGVHTVGAKELHTGITNAYKLLNPGGVLVIRAPKETGGDRPGTLAARDMVDLAHAAGFVASKAQFFDVETRSAVSRPVETLSAVFRK